MIIISEYSKKIWKKSWDDHVKDLDPKEWNISYVEAIADTFKSFPNKVAYGFFGKEHTYKMLDEYSNQFANMLIDVGFEKGDVVGICLPNIPEYVIGVVGILKAGCIVSGVSPLLSTQQIAYQLGDLGSTGKKVGLLTLDAVFAGHVTKIYSKLPQLKLCITTSVAGFMPKILGTLGKLVGKIPKGKVTPLSGIDIVDFHKDLLVNYPTTPVDVKVSADDIAFIQYTGGTTGPPKGAILTHSNFVSDMVIFQRWLDWKRGTGVGLSGFPFFHIAGLFTCSNVLWLGWTQVLIPNPRDTNHIIKEMKKYKPTVLANVPTLYAMLIANPKFHELDHSRLEVLMSAAAPFPKDAQETLESTVGEGKLMELYGMTETSPLTVGNPARGKKKLGHIGLPLTNLDLKLTDPATNQEVPLGEPGEICVKGPMVMREYFNKPEETKKAIDSDGYMHTGDVAIMDEEGYLRIVDRTKDMIIVSGFKVFSAKVEDTLTGHPAIGMVALVGVSDPSRPGSEIVKAFVQLDPDYAYDGNEEALKDSIIEFAKANCSPYEVPKQIEISDELPLTTVGKIDKKVLRK